VLPPWHANIGKRQVRSPKVYVADSGMLHALLGITTRDELFGHPKSGASWEGFALQEVIRRIGARPEDCYFWATHGGAELDLVVLRGDRRLGFEVKHTTAPRTTRSQRSALESLELEELVVVHAGSASFRLDEHIRAVALADLAREIS
ncbi:MAG: DUF4143 domain-containing protein, partial [Candidatus Eisenbacteria bacterium]|nr:DUF4143 domain-containing protein [Candidatus Eisenbacteria bacterium]